VHPNVRRTGQVFGSALACTLLVFLTLLAPVLLAQTERPYVVLVSMDGFRYDYAERFQTRNILAVRDQGAAAESIIPAFPSLTFPNHLAIVTGLYPEHHGIVSNAFFDAPRGAQYSLRAASTEGSWMDARATPLWMLAERQQVIAASMFWHMSDAEIRGMRPTYWKLFDDGFPNDQRVDQVLNWLKLPPDKRPHFITLYFSDTDHAGHTFGPESQQTAEAAQRVDAMIGKLRQGLDALHLPVNLILVSDHGMEDVEEEISLDPSEARVVTDGPLALIYCRDAASIEKTYEQLKRNPKIELYKRVETPASWHYNENPRSGDLVAIAKGKGIFAPMEPRRGSPPKGMHGYDAQKNKSMHGIFYAIGPNVKPLKIAAFENVNVYPFIAKILGLTITGKLDGSEAVLDRIYEPARRNSRAGVGK
jgi:predicted AlkP superfamily pyrophosphatase or phosphodiesterase